MGRAIEVAGLELAHPIMNAAGTCKSLPDVRQFTTSGTAAVVLGSFTLDRRPEQPDSYRVGLGRSFSLNTRKLNNGGHTYLKRYGPAMSECCEMLDKPLILNIAGDNPEEFGAVAKLAVACGFAAIEVNLSCPTGSAPIYFQREPTALVMNAVSNAVRGRIPVLYKLGFIADPILLKSQINLIVGKGADGLVAINTIGGTMLFNPGTWQPEIKSKPIGMGGPAILPLGVGMVSQLRELCRDVDLIGVGGIATGFDVQQYLTAGAKAVQAGTLCWAAGRNPQVYDDLVADYESLVSA